MRDPNKCCSALKFKNCFASVSETFERGVEDDNLFSPASCVIHNRNRNKILDFDWFCTLPFSPVISARLRGYPIIQIPKPFARQSCTLRWVLSCSFLTVCTTD